MNRTMVREYLMIFIGTLLTALALDVLLVPNRIAAGGVSGIGTILFYSSLHIPVGITMLALNIPLFLISTKRLGSSFGAKTLLGAILLSLFTDLLEPFLPHIATSAPMLAALYGGAISGLGMGLVFWAGGTTAGTDLAAALVHSYSGLPLGQALLSVDFFVIAAAGIAFANAELAMYALLSLFLTSTLIDLVQEGFNHSRAAFIICADPSGVSQRIMTELGRGCTGLHGQGKYTGLEREVLLCVVGRTEISRLKGIVHDVDPCAFVIMTNVHEVLGEGFKRLR